MQVNFPHSVPQPANIVPPVLILVVIIRQRVSSVEPARFLSLPGRPCVLYVRRILLLVRWAPLHVRLVVLRHTLPLVHQSVTSAHGARFAQRDHILLPLVV